MRRGLLMVLVLAGCGGGHRTAPNATPSPQPIAVHRHHQRRHHRRAAVVARATAIQHGPDAHRFVALTFDADMTPQMRDLIQDGKASEQINRQVIGTLRRTHTPATLFLTGMWAKRYPAEVRALAADGFELGNHTWDHRAWTNTCFGLPGGLTAAGKRAELARTARLLHALTGRTPSWLRFPGLCHDPDALRVAKAAHEQTIDGLASGDAFQPDPAVIVRTVLSEVHSGSIIVMHMMGPPNAPATGPALATLIPRLRALGYHLVTVGQLLSRPASTRLTGTMP